MTKATRIAAFFDIDGTLARDSLLIRHFKKLIQYDIIDESYWINRIKPMYRLYDTRFGEYDDYLDELLVVYKEKLKGLNRHIIEFTSKQVVDEYGDVVYKYSRERILWHQAQGHKVFFISGSPDFLVQEMAKKYDITEFRATHYITDADGNYTSELVPMWDSVSKNRVVQELIDAYDLDPEQCYSYGDTNGDFSMLKTLKRATAINPTHRLLSLIREDEELQSRIRIVVERKDVIYMLHGDVSATNSIHMDEDMHYEHAFAFDNEDWDEKYK